MVKWKADHSNSKPLRTKGTQAGGSLSSRFYFPPLFHLIYYESQLVVVVVVVGVGDAAYVFNKCRELQCTVSSWRDMIHAHEHIKLTLCSRLCLQKLSTAQSPDAWRSACSCCAAKDMSNMFSSHKEMWRYTYTVSRMMWPYTLPL